MEAKELVSTTPIEQLVENLGANSVFGEPTVEYDAAVIPVAQVSFGFGYGGGYGEGPVNPEGLEETGSDQDGQEEAGSAETEASGGGGGGGAGGRATPRGYIRITRDGVKYESIEDEKILPLAGIVMVAWSVFWALATIRYIAKVVAKTKQANK